MAGGIWSGVDAGDQTHHGVQGQNGAAAVADEGQGQTDNRSNADTHTDVAENLENQGGGGAEAYQPPDIVLAVSTHPDAPGYNQAQENNHKQAAEEAQLLADGGEDEVCVLGKQSAFCLGAGALIQSLSCKAAAGEGAKAQGGVVAFVDTQRVQRGVKQHQNPLLLIGVQELPDNGGGHRNGAAGHQKPDNADAAGKGHADEDKHENQGNTQISGKHHVHTGQKPQMEYHMENRGDGGNLILMGGHHRGHNQNIGDFTDFRRLDVHRHQRNVQPALVAGAVVGAEGNQQQQQELEERTEELKKIMEKEQEDVDRLEGKSLAAFFYRISGRMDEKMSKEKEEAYSAAVKYDAAVKELENAQKDLAWCQNELKRLSGCQQRYQQTLEQKIYRIKSTGGAASIEILELEERISRLEKQNKEIQEAMEAGNQALDITERVLKELGNAESWGTFDVFGGGLLSDLQKHSHLDRAQGMIEDLQEKLRRFRTELADVAMENKAEFQVNIQGFLRFADYFFDNIFTDWTVLNRINESKKQVFETKTEILQILESLKGIQNRAAQQKEETKEKLAQAAIRTKV